MENKFDFYTSSRDEVRISFNDILLVKVNVDNLISVGEREVMFSTADLDNNKPLTGITFPDRKVRVKGERLKNNVIVISLEDLDR